MSRKPNKLSSSNWLMLVKSVVTPLFFQLSLFDRKIDRKRLRSRVPTSTNGPLLQDTWLRLGKQYFPEREDLNEYSVVWSTRRQKRVLASCSLNKKMVRVARELDDPKHLTWLEPLLYHEMCHAVLGHNVGERGGKRAWHGPAFRALEKRHPLIRDLDTWIRSGGWSRAVRSERSRASRRRALLK